MAMDELSVLLPRYRDGLLHDTLPFWLEHGLDRVHGGVHTSLGRGGELLDSDKAVWAQGRFAWLLATLHDTCERRDDWLEGALSCLRFLEDHAFDSDGRMFFLVTDEGRPLRKRRYAYSEAFATLAFAACAKVTGREVHARRAVQLFDQFIEVSLVPGTSTPKVDPVTRPSKGIGPLMIGVNVAQELRRTIGFDGAETRIRDWIDEIERDFCKPEIGAVMELVSADGSMIDHFEGRLLNPGHALEAAWFILEEARHAGGDRMLTDLGSNIIDWTWGRGWDEEHGGLYSFCDVDGQPMQVVEHDMKYWWPHNEACIATLLAAKLTGEQRFIDRHLLVHEWSHRHFADREHGEWYGYLHRDGSPATTLKGNHWKGPFHLPRMQWKCWQELESARASVVNDASRG